MFAKKGIKRILTSRLFWLSIIALVFSLFVLINSMSFMRTYHVISKVNNIAYATTEGFNTMTEFYDDALQQEGFNPDVTFGEEIPSLPEEDPVEEEGGGSTGNGTVTVPDSTYDGVKDHASAIEGSSVLHQMHNAIVKEVASSKFSWFQYWLVIGKNMKEANGFGGSWIPHIGADRRGLQDPNYNINTWGASAVTNFSDIATFYNNKPYIGPFQTAPDYYFGHGKFSGTIDTWRSKVESSSARFDGNGDGKSDPFNYLDGLKAMHYHNEVKWGETNRYMSFVSDQYKDDMIGMSIAARYVGISNSKGTKRFPAGSGPWTGYTHHENLNPHIQLMRKFAEEYHSNGPHFQKFKQHLSQYKTLNGNDIQYLVNDFFNAQPGWVATGNSGNGSLTYTFPDGKTMKFTGQNMHYPFLVYWGGKVAEEEITKALTK